MTGRVPFKPYMLRAFHEWLTELGETPQILVNCSVDGVNVPIAHIKDGRIILNISYNAADKLFISNTEIKFATRFGNNQMQVRVPMEAVLLIYSRETNDSIPFTTLKGITVEHKPPVGEDSSEKSFQKPQQKLPVQGGFKKGELATVLAKPARDTSHLRIVK